MDDRINWFQGWIIILMIFTGISMLVHYETAAMQQSDAYYKQATLERQLIRADIATLNARLSIRSADVMAEVKRVQDQHEHMMELLTPESRSAWFDEQLRLRGWKAKVKASSP